MTATVHPTPARLARDTDRTVDRDPDRLVDRAGIDSFPASDPPGWWAGSEPAPVPHHEEDDATWQ